MEQENYLWAEWSSQEFCQQMFTYITKKRTADSRKKCLEPVLEGHET